VPNNVGDKILQLDRDQEEVQAKIKAEALKMPYINLSGRHIDENILKLIPKEQIEGLQCVPIALAGHLLTVGVVDPQSQGVVDGLKTLQEMTGYQIKTALVSATSFAYGKKSYDLLVKTNEGERPVVLDSKNQDELLQLSAQLKSGKVDREVTVSDLFLAIMAEAVQQKSSDIHFEPDSESLKIRFRIDGVLHLVMERPTGDYHGLESRIKYLAKMPLSATSKPQDGRFTIQVSDAALDLRVASLPTVYGEMMVIRILNQSQVMLPLSQLGLRPDLEQMARSAFTKPHGLILVTGPTGSGKTTTLYAILQELNTPERKIITIEDPVEYKIAGLEQSQVDAERGYDFVDALRGALRQDPDIIMIGEIRDKETANIGIRAALTGHIVLATLHSNTAPASYSRLLEMEIEPFLFSGSINLIIAQRLVRLLCPNCKKGREVTSQEAKTFQKEIGRIPSQIFDAVGCSQCRNIGYSGRTAILEAFTPSRAIEQMAILQASVADFEQQAHKDGMITMTQDGLLKVEQGITTISEIYRVTAE
jgi:type IV pilus assembly protein PilB